LPFKRPGEDPTRSAKIFPLPQSVAGPKILAGVEISGFSGLTDGFDGIFDVSAWMIPLVQKFLKREKNRGRRNVYLTHANSY
jgi:hypothetical protein